MRRKRVRRTSLFNVNGKLVNVVNIRGLSDILKKSPDTIRRYERQGVFPPAIFLVMGRRYYPELFARKLSALVDKIPPNKKPDPDLLMRINKLFKEERSKYARKED